MSYDAEKALSELPKDYSSLSREELIQQLNERDSMIIFVRFCLSEEQKSSERSNAFYERNILLLLKLMESIELAINGDPTDKRTRAYKHAQQAKELNT